MIFGHRCLKTAAPRRVFAFERGEAVVFRLDEEERERVGAWPGVVTFRPFGRAPMIGWLEVPPEHRAAWAELAERALDGLRREPADAAPGGRPDPRRR
jgi:hypothetical protein